ncbi:MAG: phage protease [Proteobacteria bacterium]|nr:phage protease [Pseudomonadota bacterium]MBU1387100.1 phage protease [Pseudomonadota bacterium]MBU1541583.1 phage protease [Pseudomonadota bacterium]MBU2429529.1 phage protease [Pseudomonadota bacterium]MBU2482540.1 phage protease [Pseudomonadota bacterium]
MHRILHLISKINKDSDLAPEWMLLFAAGWGKLADGARFFVDKTSFDLVQALIASRGNEVHFDYEHASLEKQAAPAAGWIKDLIWEDNVGIKARVEWTSKASQFIAAKEYRYFSPVFFVRKSDHRVCGLDSVALTNRPKTTHLTPILARLEAGLKPDNNKEKTMTREQLIAALGLDATATDADILVVIAKAGVKTPEGQAKEVVKEVIPEAITAALKLEAGADASIVVANIHALNQTKDTSVSRQEFEALQNELAENKAGDAVIAAMNAGKIAPNQKDWATKYAKDDLKGFAAFVAAAPVVVPLDKLPGKKQEADTVVADDAVKNVASLMGVDLADVKKYNG